MSVEGRVKNDYLFSAREARHNGNDQLVVVAAAPDEALEAAAAAATEAADAVADEVDGAVGGATLG